MTALDFLPRISLANSVADVVGRDEQSNLEQVNAQMAETRQLHLQRDLEVLRMSDGFLQHQNAAVIQPFGGEESVPVPVHDGHFDIVPERGVGRAHAEEVGGDGDFGRKCQLVVGDADG